MKKLRLVLLIIGFAILSIIDLWAQDLDKIRRDAERNDQLTYEDSKNRSSSLSSSKRSSSYSSSSSSSSDPCRETLIEAIGSAIQGVIVAQTDMLEKKDSVPEMVSVETSFDANISKNAGFLFRPRLRANWGLFSTEARFYNLIARDSAGAYGRFAYFDWQPLMVNFFAKKAFKFRAGTGLSYEYFTKNTYNEHTLQVEIAPVRNFVMKAEGRWTIDYKTMMYVRQEAILELDYQIKTRKHWAFFVGFNASYNNLYQHNEFWTFGPVFRVRLQ